MCGGHGWCNQTGDCVCNPNFNDTFCDRCASGFYGPDCLIGMRESPRESRGCRENKWRAINNLFYLWLCYYFCSPTFVKILAVCDPVTACSSHGTCTPNGSCLCSTGFTGPTCDTCIANYYGTSCDQCMFLHFSPSCIYSLSHTFLL